MSNYVPTGAPPSQTRGTSAAVRAEFVSVATAIATKSDASGQTYSGTHQFPSTAYGVTAAPGSTGAAFATLDYVNAAAFSSSLPGQAVGFLRSNGTAASFGVTHTGYAVNEVKGADVASAATINLTTATGNFVHVTGSAAITSIIIPVGAERAVVFDGTPLLTHSAALLLPGAANINTAANDRMIVRGDTSGAIVVSYMRASGLAVAVVPVVNVGDHEVVVNTGNGYGSTNTKIRRFTTTLTNVGTAITYADSATLGASFTINESGLYAISYVDYGSSPPALIYGMSRNSTQLTTDISSINIADRIFGPIDPGLPASRIVRLLAGDIVRPHTSGSINGATTSSTMLTIRKVAI